MIGQRDEARARLDELLAVRNDVGLLSESYDVAQRRLSGNFPQAFSHVGLVNSAALRARAGLRSSRARRRRILALSERGPQRHLARVVTWEPRRAPTHGSSGRASSAGRREARNVLRSLSAGSTMADLLIVDDDVEAADILAIVLRAEGHDVRVARNGEEGMALLYARTPELVLLDVEMPVLTGPEVAHAMLVHNLGLQNVPIILCSGVLDLHRVAALVGTPYALAKPFTIDAMLQQIERALAERTPPHPHLPGASHEA